MWQAYWTLDVEEWRNGWKAVRFGSMKHVQRLQKMKLSQSSSSLSQHGAQTVWSPDVIIGFLL